MISARLEPLQGELAVLDLHLRLNYDETLFFESGTVAFGSDPGASTLAFSSVGTGACSARLPPTASASGS